MTPEDEKRIRQYLRACSRTAGFLEFSDAELVLTALDEARKERADLESRLQAAEAHNSAISTELHTYRHSAEATVNNLVEQRDRLKAELERVKARLVFDEDGQPAIERGKLQDRLSEAQLRIVNLTAELSRKTKALEEIAEHNQDAANYAVDYIHFVARKALEKEPK